MKYLFILAAISSVAGCAAPGSYVSPLDNLRNSSIQQVKLYSENIKDALKTKSKDEVIEAGKQAITESLKDPQSAQFRNVRLVRYLDGAVICGEVNGKNSYGGYVGFKEFVAGNYSGSIKTQSSKYAEINAAANYGIDTACYGQEYK